MKRILYILLLFPFILSGQSVYYVQDTSQNVSASDSNDGTNINLPWATWQKAFNTADAGDTVYFRGGTWNLEETGLGARVIIDPANLEGVGSYGDSGTYENHIVFINYPGETPILDATNSHQFEEALLVRSTNYVDLIGLTVQGKKGVYPDDTAQIFRQFAMYNNGTLRVERCVSRYSHGYGFTINSWDTLYVINCDSYEHYDSIWYLGDGNKPDGFAISSGGEATDYGYLYGNRAWRCSDDGFETSWSPFLLVDNCWSFCNGYGTAGIGIGFKLEEGYIENKDTRIYQHNISAYNSSWAYSFQNLNNATNGPICNFYNNLSYNDQGAFQSVYSTYFTDCVTGDTYLNFRNNIAYKVNNKVLNLVTCQYSMIGAKWFGSNNTWKFADNSYKYVDNDTVNWANTGKDDQFVALPADSADCQSILSAPRKADGSLPDIGNYFKLAPTSDLIDAGIDVGLPYSGDAPDLGPFEYSVTPSTNHPKRLTPGAGVLRFGGKTVILKR